MQLLFSITVLHLIKFVSQCIQHYAVSKIVIEWIWLNIMKDNLMHLKCKSINMAVAFERSTVNR